MTLLATTVPTWAGKVNTPGVRIGSNQVVQYASGSMVGARYSVDTKQFIGCRALVSYYVSSNGSSPQAVCFARDSAGNYLMCANGSFEATGLNSVEALHGMTDTSYIYFEMLRPRSNCNRIVIYNGSENRR
jgi:hypothetical protein